MKIFSEFERWALALPVPWLEVPALVEPTDIDLAERWHLLALHHTDGEEKHLATTLIRMGSLDYLQEESCRKE